MFLSEIYYITFEFNIIITVYIFMAKCTLTKSFLETNVERRYKDIFPVAIKVENIFHAKDYRAI